MWAAVPVKTLSESKTRLKSLLDANQREQLQLALVQGLLETLASSTEVQHTIVVTSDQQVARLARSSGAEVLPEPQPSSAQTDHKDPATATEPGLNAAAQSAAEYAANCGATSLLVLPGDLPLITTADVAELYERAERHAHAVVVTPDRHGLGTNAMVSRPPGAISFAFGPGSCEEHLTRAAQAGAQAIRYVSETLALDLDTPDDVGELFLRHTARPKVQAVLDQIQEGAQSACPLKPRTSEVEEREAETRELEASPLGTAVRH